MERTQKLLSIALAVLALDGCRGSERVAGPRPTGSPGSTSHSSSGYHYSHSFHHFGRAAAGGFIGGAAAAHSRGLGGAHGGMHGGGFGGAGAHGGG